MEPSYLFMNALIMSWLDYGNAFLYGMADGLLTKLQLVQNIAARLVAKVPKYERITPTLEKIQWLPVTYRIQFKMLVYIYRSLHDLAPDYLADIEAQFEFEDTPSKTQTKPSPVNEAILQMRFIPQKEDMAI